MRYMYALMHKPTGKFIPDVRGNTRTRVEPADPQEQLPRFFTKSSIAKGFLTVWCKGPLKKILTQDWETGYVDWTLEHRPKNAKQPRIAEEWEVVRIEWRVA